MLRAFSFFCTLLLLTGCATRVSTDSIRSSFDTGHVTELRQKMEKTHESYGEFVTALNLGRLLQVEGKWQESIQRYDEALAMLEEYESRAVINVREVASTAGTILLARGAKQYYGTGYERSLLHTFNSLNYVMLGDFAGAAVEMRKMDKRQEYWLQESESRIQKNLDSRPDSVDLPTQYSMREMLEDEDVRSLINNYQDSFSYALSSILFRIAGDMQACDVNMRRAIALDNNADELFRNAWSQQQEKKETGRKKNVKKNEAINIPSLPPLVLPSAGADAPILGKVANKKADLQEVTIIALSGLTPSLKVEHVRVSFPKIGYILLDLPSYTHAVSGTAPNASFSSTDSVVFYPLLRTDRLAYRTLQDEVNFEMGSAISRAAVRAGVSAAVYAGMSSSDDTKNYAELASVVSTMLLDLLTHSMSVSVRNWETLPNEGYIAMATVPNGSTITLGQGSTMQSLTLPNNVRGVIIVLTRFSNAHLKMDYVTY